MKHHVLTVAILTAAVVLYSIGMTTGSMVLFAVGATCELWFWGRILRPRKST